MASWHLQQNNTNNSVGELSIFWADNRMNGTVKKACPNFALFVPTFTSLVIFEKHLKRCGRRNILDHSLFANVGKERIHLFNADQRSIELYISLWGHTLTSLGNFTIELQKKPAINYADIYHESDYHTVKEYFIELNKRIMSSPPTVSDIESQLLNLDMEYKLVDKMAPKQPKTKKTETNKTTNKKRTVQQSEPKVSKTDANHENKKTNNDNSPKTTSTQTTSNKRVTLSSFDREFYVPQKALSKPSVGHVCKQNQPRSRSFIERHCRAPTLSSSPNVASTIKVEKLGEVFTLRIPNSKKQALSKQVRCDKLIFKTRKGAKTAIEAIENKNFERTDAVLYLSKRTGEDGSVNRTYFPIASQNNDLIDAIVNDWGGTPFGYSLHKSWNLNTLESEIKPLYQTEEGMKYIEDLLSSGSSLNLSHGSIPMIAM